MRHSSGFSTSSMVTGGTWTSGPAKPTTRSIRMCWATSLRSTSTRKQMGAYYTKEDITGYISRNTVIPFLFDVAKKECPCSLPPGRRRVASAAGQSLIDTSIPPVGHGVTWNARQAEDPETAWTRFLPTAAPTSPSGIGDVARRSGWNKHSARTSLRIDLQRPGARSSPGASAMQRSAASSPPERSKTSTTS